PGTVDPGAVLAPATGTTQPLASTTDALSGGLSGTTDPVNTVAHAALTPVTDPLAAIAPSGGDAVAGTTQALAGTTDALSGGLSGATDPVAAAPHAFITFGDPLVPTVGGTADGTVAAVSSTASSAVDAASAPAAGAVDTAASTVASAS